ncbi:MAG: tetratricopeptide repeat protein [Anaerolineae bacterium]|nr:tetratricopeptide repeat protein [Anaerolineae bacterium]MDW8298122.1 tetratricopeptide repeat protein [Anaerolineae bacterium]
MNKLRISALMLLGLLTIAGLSLAPLPNVVAQESATPTATPTIVTPEDALRRAEEVAQSAQNALETVSRMLSFLEVAGAIAGIVLALATTVGAGAFVYISRRIQRTLKDAEQLRESSEQMLRTIEQRGERATRAATLLQIGVQQMMAHNMNAALQTFEEAHTLDPDNRAVNYYLGELYSQNNDPERAIPLLRTSADEFPQAEAALGYALRLQASRQNDPNLRNQLYAQAEQHFLRALERDKQARDINGASFWATLGGLYRRQGRLDDAIRAYEEASRVTPHSSYPLNNLAMLYLMKGDLEKASETFRRSLRIATRLVDGDPFDHWARFDLITAHAAMRNYDAAEAQFELLAESPPVVGALESFLSGLEALQKSAYGNTRTAQLIERVKALIDQQRGAQPAQDHS